MEKTIWFYRDVLGFAIVAEQNATVAEGGIVRLVYFDVGEGGFIVFMQGTNVPQLPVDFDTGINGQLGVPPGMYHYAFKESSLEGLSARRDQLENAGVQVSDLVDHGYAQAIYVMDPNGLQLEFCWQVRHFGPQDLSQSSVVTVADPEPPRKP
ncbi:VOC family protein [Paracoccus sp. YLB-12]|uniref:VOC family protein n=2 Tax=Paracoccus maritimus TaxID=2933292 RepID=A0ABT2KCY5_9RHOB|nr:VOC family protein [Paracoccus sp. YLB-12]